MVTPRLTEARCFLVRRAIAPSMSGRLTDRVPVYGSINGERRNDFRDWHVQVMIDRQVRLRQRMERLYNYAAAAIAI
jgi:hypothetical protein